MNKISIVLRSLSLVGALTAGYLWHETGLQKERQLSVISQQNSDLRNTSEELALVRAKLAGAESKLDSHLKLFEGQKAQLSAAVEQLSDSRRENDTLREKLMGQVAQLAEAEQKTRTLEQETESLRTASASSVPKERLAVVQQELARSKELAKQLQDRVDALTQVDIPANVPPPVVVSAPPRNFNKIVTARVKQVKGDKVLLEFGRNQGAILDSDVRVQDGLNYVGLGRVIFANETQSLVTLNKGHQTIAEGKEVFLYVPEAVGGKTLGAPAK